MTFALFILISQIVFGVSVAAEYCWTSYSPAAYFVAAKNKIYCQNGDRFTVKNSSFSSEASKLDNLTNAAMKKKGYELLVSARDSYSNTLDGIYVRGVPRYAHYCKIFQKSGYSKLTCPKKESALYESVEFSITSTNLESLNRFLQSKNFQKILVAADPVAPLKNTAGTLTLYGSDSSNQSLCDSTSETLAPPFTMNCI